MELTKVQREILELLRDGGMMVFDERNIPSVGDRQVTSRTRYFLSRHQLVKRFDRDLATGDRGNGLVISDRGLDVLAAQVPATKRSSTYGYSNKAPTDRQLRYATHLGIAVPEDATRGDVSILISATLDEADANAEAEELRIESNDGKEPEATGCGCMLAMLAGLLVIVVAVFRAC